MSSPHLPPDLPAPPPGVPPQSPPRTAGFGSPPPRDGRGVAFFVAIFLGILLVASAGLNVLLLLLGLGSIAGAGLGDLGDGPFDEVHVAGQKGAATRVLQIPIRGAIAESATPLLGASGGTVSQVRRALRHAAGNDVHGVLLAIDSPGGGVTDSDEIHGLLRAFRRDHPQKPVLALFGDMAASGGYYVAASAEHIVARRSTITGSIGVIMSAWNFAEAAKKFGVEQVAIVSERTPFKDLLSPTRPMREAERALLTAIVDELYDQFVDVVDAGREKLDRAQVLALANGAIYTAGQALSNGLIDEIGDQEAAVRWFRQRLGVEVEVVEHRRRLGLGDLLFGSRAAPQGPEQAIGRLLAGTSGPRFLYFWEGGR